MALYFENDLDISFDFDLEQIAQDVISCALKLEKFPFGADIGLSIVTNEDIQQINYLQRHINSATDVLSFPMLEYLIAGDFSNIIEGGPDFNNDTGNVNLGDIVISADKVIEQAKLYNHSQLREYAFLIAHSMLHLMGYDHMTPEDEETMIIHQNKILDNLGITR